MAYGDFKDLPGKTIANKILRDKSFYIAKNLKNDGYHFRLAWVIYKFFGKKMSNTNKGAGINSDIKELSKELHKPISRTF